MFWLGSVNGTAGLPFFTQIRFQLKHWRWGKLKHTTRSRRGEQPLSLFLSFHTLPNLVQKRVQSGAQQSSCIHQSIHRRRSFSIHPSYHPRFYLHVTSAFLPRLFTVTQPFRHGEASFKQSAGVAGGNTCPRNDCWLKPVFCLLCP